MAHRFTRDALALLFLTLATQGCNFDLDFGEYGFLGGPELQEVPERLALGASVVVTVDALNPDPNIVVSNPAVVEVEHLDATHLRLTGVGVGEATVVVEDQGAACSYRTEVARPAGYELFLVDRGFLSGPVPIVHPGNKAVLSDVNQTFVIAYFDSNGPLHGRGLASVDAPPRSQECEANYSSVLDAHCFVLEEGLHVMHVQVGGETEEIVFGAVPAEDLVGLDVRGTDEANAQAGDLIEMIAVGVTASGTPVYGLEPLFGSQVWVYEFDPSEPPQEVSVRALGFELKLRYRGAITTAKELWSPSWFQIFGC